MDEALESAVDPRPTRGDLPLNGKVAIVTGGGSGIGRAACCALAGAGASVVVVGRTAERLEETLGQARRSAGDGVSLLALPADVRRAEDMAAMADEVLAKYGQIDVLVASAGILRALEPGPKAVANLSFEAWSSVLSTNLRGTFLANRAVLPAMMRQRSGDILNLSSTSGLRGFAYDAAYCASKFAIIGFSESLREEVRRYGIRVQTLLPGPVDTGIWTQNRPVPPPERLLPVERVADTILYLLTLPREVAVDNPVLIPFRPHRRPAWRSPGPGVGANVGRGESLP